MTRTGEDGSLKYLEHKPGFLIKENTCRYWCEHEKEFPGWELYVPDVYIAKIKQDTSIEDPECRDHINFDSHYLLSVF